MYSPSFSKSCACLIFGSGSFDSRNLLTIIFDVIRFFFSVTSGWVSLLRSDLGSAICGSQFESTSELLTTCVLLTAFFFSFRFLRTVVHFSSLMTLGLFGTVTVLSRSSVLTKGALLTMSVLGGTTPPVNINEDFTFTSARVGCLRRRVTTLTNSSLSVPVLSAHMPSCFLQAKANRLIASCISNALLAQQNMQRHCELGFEHLLYAVGLKRVHILWNHLLHSSHCIPSSTGKKQFGCPHLCIIPTILV
ncbi:unnamed protein product [Schistosoma mattheei]|uniref:Uncharacterized protein n=1 Tax=Schistosoma mattheei TaxID=31246 RepID=A0AA85BTJ0_9TREM|nr:unnamed protein product [Schistosoma mattheei]